MLICLVSGDPLPPVFRINARLIFIYSSGHCIFKILLRKTTNNIHIFVLFRSDEWWDTEIIGHIVLISSSSQPPLHLFFLSPIGLLAVALSVRPSVQFSKNIHSLLQTHTLHITLYPWWHTHYSITVTNTPLTLPPCCHTLCHTLCSITVTNTHLTLPPLLP